MLGVYDLRHADRDGEQVVIEFSGVSVDINVDCAAVFASKPAPSGSAATPDRMPAI
jgi:hypothetical protein